MDIFSILKFSREWEVLGIITPVKLLELEAEWNIGEDRNTEHYRWRVFVEFMQSAKSLDESTMKALYQLGVYDPDMTMGSAMMAEILRHKNCPVDLLQSASTAPQKFLQKIANERLALRCDNY